DARRVWRGARPGDGSDGDRDDGDERSDHGDTSWVDPLSGLAPGRVDGGGLASSFPCKLRQPRTLSTSLPVAQEPMSADRWTAGPIRFGVFEVDLRSGEL